MSDGEQRGSLPESHHASGIGAPLKLLLTDFERYMVADDRPSYPMVITMALQLSGELHREAFVDAVTESLGNHMLLRSLVVGKGTKAAWEPTGRTAAIDWVDGIGSTSPPVPHIDLRNAIGLQVRVKWTKARSVVYFFLHHACCDGISSVRFIAEVLSRYGRTSGDDSENSPLPVVRQSLLECRGDTEAVDGVRPQLWDFVREVVNIFTRDARVVRSSTARLSEQPGRAIITRTLSRTRVRALRAAAMKMGVTVNDLCTAEFACTLASWNGNDKRAGRFRLLVPLSMRLPQHDGMPAANCISYLPIEFDSVEMSDLAVVAKAVHLRTTYALSCNFGLVFLKALRMIRSFPRVLGRFTSARRRLCTAVLASVGDVRRHVPLGFPQSQGRLVAGNLRVDRIDGVAPIRPNTAVAVSFGRYAGEMIFNMRADPRLLSDRDADALLDAFVTRLEEADETKLAKAAA